MKPGNIVAHSGQIIDVTRIQPDQVGILDIAHSLALQCRYNGHCDKFYSVAEHSVRCSYFTHICPNPAALLLHDAAEAYIGDIVRGVKYIRLLYKHIKPLEASIQAVIWKRFNIKINGTSTVKQIKTVDDIMLITEALQLGVEKAAYYYNNKDAKPEPGLIIDAWDWQKAQMMFLKRAHEVLK